jgi:hypothetical protein
MINNNDKNFLLDDDFILWQLTGDQSLDAYWKVYMENNPSARKEFDAAILEFSKIRLDKAFLSDVEFIRLRQRIHTSVAQLKTKKRIQRFVSYVAAACLILIIAGSFYYNYTHTEKEKLSLENMIVGENLSEKDIYLITDAATTSFKKDVVVQIDKNGKTTVQETGGEKSTMPEVETTAMNKLVVPYGKRAQLELSDGTKVWLNSGSVLEFPATFTGKTRNINLVGEMYIDVTKDSKTPFFVYTPDFQIKVCGTKFNVSAYHDNNFQSVVLVEGSVGVKMESKDETFLLPNDMLVYRDNHLDKKKVDVMQYVSWKDGYILLDHTPIDAVLKRIERYYNLSFDIQDNVDITLKTCTGKIYLSDNLDDVMTAISLLSSVKYIRDNKIIYIHVNP